jgi:hypothetical protein
MAKRKRMKKKEQCQKRYIVPTLDVMSYVTPFWSLPAVFSGVHVARSLGFCVMFCRSVFSLFHVFFGYCIVCFSSIYGFLLPLCYRLAIVLSVLRFTASDYLFVIVWPLCCLSFDLRLLITSLFSFGNCVVCPSIYVFWLPLCNPLAIVLFVIFFLYICCVVDIKR